MPELPEVETIRRGLLAGILARPIDRPDIRQPALRWPVPVPELTHALTGARFHTLDRRGKYLLFGIDPTGWLLVHLGMSGSLHLLEHDTPWQKHDHWDIVFVDGGRLRYRDPRRFGAALWVPDTPLAHPLLRSLGVEPLTDACTGDVLYRQASRRRQVVKLLIMDGTVVVGVGNIYASEALFRARIHPHTPARDLDPDTCGRLAQAIKETLSAAIVCGGTTLRDFSHSDGRPGYFQQQLAVYGRTGAPCPVCQTLIEGVRTCQRSTFFCPHCQIRPGYTGNGSRENRQS